MAAAGIGFLALVIVTVGVGGLVLYVLAIVEVAKLPDHAFGMTGKEKLTWVLIVVLASWVGALIWWFGPRKEVKAAAEAYPVAPPRPVGGPPPGWYPDPSGASGQRWWDGWRWTDRSQLGPPG